MTKKINSKDKGSRYERKVKNKLELWSGEVLHKVPQSGAWSGDEADVTAGYGHYFPFVVECKNVEGWTFEQILAHKGGFWKWMKQTLRQTKAKVEKSGYFHYPMLAFTRNYVPSYVCVPVEIYMDMVVDFTLITPHIMVTDPETMKHYIITELDKFTELVDYEDFLFELEMNHREE